METQFDHTPPPDPPMEAPRIVLLGLAAACVALLAALMLIDLVWTLSGPVTVADPINPTPPNVEHLQEATQPVTPPPAG